MNIWRKGINQDKLKKLIDYLYQCSSGNGISLKDFDTKFILKELQNSINPKKLVRGNIVKTLNKMKNENLELDVSSFSKIYQSIKSNKNYNYTFIIPLTIRFEKNKRIIKLCGREFKVVTLKKLKEVYGKNTFDHNTTQTSILENGLIPKHYLTIEETDSSPAKAWDTIKPIFYLFKGIIEYSICSFRIRYQSHDKPIGDYRLPSWIAVAEKSNIFTYLTINNSEKCKIIDLRNDSFHTFNDLVKILGNKIQKDSILILLKQILALYAEALESTRDITFLTFWQILEAFCLPENFRGSSNIETVKRLRFLVSKIHIFRIDYICTFNSIKNKRNDLVHRGLSRIEQDDVNFLKILIEMLIKWLINNKSIFETKSIFYQYLWFCSDNNYNEKLAHNFFRTLDKVKFS
jgi:hypothetical protein